jgi:hypothetical protein
MGQRSLVLGDGHLSMPMGLRSKVIGPVSKDTAHRAKDIDLMSTVIDQGPIIFFSEQTMCNFLCAHLLTFIFLSPLPTSPSTSVSHVPPCPSSSTSGPAQLNVQDQNGSECMKIVTVVGEERRVHMFLCSRVLRKVTCRAVAQSSAAPGSAVEPPQNT